MLSCRSSKSSSSRPSRRRTRGGAPRAAPGAGLGRERRARRAPPARPLLAPPRKDAARSPVAHAQRGRAVGRGEASLREEVELLAARWRELGRARVGSEHCDARGASRPAWRAAPVSELEDELAAWRAQHLVDAGQCSPERCGPAGREKEVAPVLARRTRRAPRRTPRRRERTPARRRARGSAGRAPPRMGRRAAGAHRSRGIVAIQAPSSSRARSWRPSSRRLAPDAHAQLSGGLRVYVITRIESTSMPRSQTARTSRSTSTAVLPVPAPAERNTGRRPRSPSAAPGSGRACSRAADPAHRPQLAPLGALAAARVVPTSPARMRCASPRVVAGESRPGARTRRPRRSPSTSSRRAPRPGASARSRPRGLVAGERPVDAAERLDSDQVAEDEHVQRDLEPELLLDLARRVRCLARLVVLHDPARAEWVGVDAVDLSAQGAPRRGRAALKLLRRALHAERDLEAASARAGASASASTWTSASRSRQSEASSSRRCIVVISM